VDRRLPSKQLQITIQGWRRGVGYDRCNGPCIPTADARNADVHAPGGCSGLKALTAEFPAWVGRHPSSSLIALFSPTTGRYPAKDRCTRPDHKHITPSERDILFKANDD